MLGSNNVCMVDHRCVGRSTDGEQVVAADCFSSTHGLSMYAWGDFLVHIIRALDTRAAATGMVLQHVCWRGAAHALIRDIEPHQPKRAGYMSVEESR